MPHDFGRKPNTGSGSNKMRADCQPHSDTRLGPFPLYGVADRPSNAPKAQLGATIRQCECDDLGSVKSYLFQQIRPVILLRNFCVVDPWRQGRLPSSVYLTACFSKPNRPRMARLKAAHRDRSDPSERGWRKYRAPKARRIQAIRASAARQHKRWYQCREPTGSVSPAGSLQVAGRKRSNWASSGMWACKSSMTALISHGNALQSLKMDTSSSMAILWGGSFCHPAETARLSGQFKVFRKTDSPPENLVPTLSADR